jgi:hypothetical protein
MQVEVFILGLIQLDIVDSSSYWKDTSESNIFDDIKKAMQIIENEPPRRPVIWAHAPWCDLVTKQGEKCNCPAIPV